MSAADRLLNERFDQALNYAIQLHADQLRKGSGVPYLAHLLSVTALVLEDGGSEDEAIAALLHDAVEDQGGLATLEEIRSKFGTHVADIVAGCTDSFEDPRPPWKQRKDRYLQHLAQATPEVRRVSLADKLHNAAFYPGESAHHRFAHLEPLQRWQGRHAVVLSDPRGDIPAGGAFIHEPGAGTCGG